MINIRFGIIKDNLKLLNSILDEAVSYGIWSVFYGDEEIADLKSLKIKVDAAYDKSLSSDQGSYPLDLSFKEGQIFKKVIVFYLTNNFKKLSREEFETITDFILFVDDSLAFELEEM